MHLITIGEKNTTSNHDIFIKIVLKSLRCRSDNIATCDMSVEEISLQGGEKCLLAYAFFPITEYI